VGGFAAGRYSFSGFWTWEGRRQLENMGGGISVVVGVRAGGGSQPFFGHEQAVNNMFISVALGLSAWRRDIIAYGAAAVVCERWAS